MAGMHINFDEAGQGNGKFNSLDLRLNIAFEPLDDIIKLPEYIQSKNPFFTVYGDKGNGMSEIGAAWIKKLNSPGNKMNGELFLSVTFDDLSFPDGVNIAIWPQKKDQRCNGDYAGSWTRQTAKRAAA